MLNTSEIFERLNFCLIFPASNRQLHLTQDEVLLLGQSVRAGESPTGGVLHHMNTLGLTMIDLYHHLKRANLPKAMDIVKKYGKGFMRSV